MFRRLLVPLDGSPAAARALVPAAHLGRVLDRPIRVVRFVTGPVDEQTRDTVADQIAAVDLIGVTVTADVETATDSVASAIVAECMSEEGTLTIMSTNGTGRTGAVLGSVVDGVLARGCGPALLIGPQCDLDRLAAGGRLVVPLDGSPLAETVLPIVGPLATALDLKLQIVSVIEPAVASTHESDLPPESSMVRAVARSVEKETGAPVDYEVLHGDSPAGSIVDWADEASMVAMSTHGRTGLARLVAGSVAMEVIHRAPCPVLVHRPGRFS